MKVTFHHSLQRGMKKNHLGWWHAERASPTPDFNRFPSLVHQSQLSWACLEALMQSDESSNTIAAPTIFPFIIIVKEVVYSQLCSCKNFKSVLIIMNVFQIDLGDKWIYTASAPVDLRDDLPSKRKGKNRKEGEKIMDVRHATIKKVLWDDIMSLLLGWRR